MPIVSCPITENSSTTPLLVMAEVPGFYHYALKICLYAAAGPTPESIPELKFHQEVDRLPKAKFRHNYGNKPSSGSKNCRQPFKQLLQR